MNDNCDLCFNKLNDSAFDIRNSKSQHTGIHLNALIENVFKSIECLENITIVCKDCNDLLLELDIVRCRFLEIQNIIKQYFEKRQPLPVHSADCQSNENAELISGPQKQIQDDELFDEIIDNHSCKDEDISDTFHYSNPQIFHQNRIENKSKEEEKPQFTCHCSKSFRTSNHLKKHLRSHNNEKPFVCEVCGQAYKKKASFDIHKQMHEGLSPFTCMYCNKAFTQKIALRRHVIIHTGEKPHQCEKCGKRFTHHTSFNTHKLIHMNEKPFRCLHCNETFRCSSHLTRHKRIHTGEKKFGCSVCGKHFAEKYNLVVHQKVHESKNSSFVNKGKHCCQICGERFERPKKLEEHKVKKHFSIKIEPLPEM